MSAPFMSNCIPTGRMRWATEEFSANNTTPERKLQQEWLDMETKEVWWCDLPVAELDEKSYAKEAIRA